MDKTKPIYKQLIQSTCCRMHLKNFTKIKTKNVWCQRGQLQDLLENSPYLEYEDDVTSVAKYKNVYAE